VGAGIGLSVGVFLLVRTLYERYQLGKENKKLKKIIDIEEREMLLIQQEAKDLEKRLKEATEEDEMIKIHQEIALLHERYATQHSMLEKLKNKELHLEQKMAEVGIMQVVDKGVGICLSALTIIGLALSLFFPMAGLGILTGVAIAGGVYLLARLTAPLFQLLGNWLISKVKSVIEPPLTRESLANENILIDTKEKQHSSSLGLNTEAAKIEAMGADKNELLSDTEKSIEEHTFNSTAEVLVGLKGKKTAVEKLQSAQERALESDDVLNSVSPLFQPVPGKKEVKTEDDRNFQIEKETP